MIECSHLSKHFGPVKAVDDLSFTAQQGQVLGFLGPNGAGKSTTMKMITGYLPATSGQIKVCGIDLAEDPLAVKNKIGYLPEGAPSYQEMNVGSFLQFIARMRNIPASSQQSAVDSVVARLNLNHVYYQKIDTLSKGFKRRVGLAQAIIHDPEVLIMDEPTDGLDPNQKHQVRELITTMSKNKTIVLSTHILEEVHAVCDRAIIIANGVIVADSTPNEMEVMSRYHHAVSFVADLDTILLNKIKNMDCVRDVTYSARLKETTVFPTQGLFIFDEISSLLKQEGIQVTSLKMEAGRLDEVFRNITKPVQNKEVHR
ncbi:ABC transporter ATP-binding protein [Marinicella gelatinilytica]|uniref:ABC transporter ATP-binding protein n=1 Tax=Marinicella gelatinilytica TaxID=2996017 RepID=UPI002260E176|nr:ATP-binding cassette domain-containing protein [Marinicella gelatinilytica]MCX7544856.1 ATP-binding cassette domain-containing protein [Marinicella gelatinilytica]